MNKFLVKSILTIAVAGCGLFAQQVSVTYIPAGPNSAVRISETKKLVMDYFLNNGTEGVNVDIANSIMPDFLKKNPGIAAVPEKDLLTSGECEDSARDALKKAADEKFPVLSKKQLAAMAEERYPLYEKGARVKVNYALSPEIPLMHEGFYYGTQNGIVTIGTLRIRLEDMDRVANNHEEMLKFNPEGTAALREEFIKRYVYDTNKSRKAFFEENTAAIVGDEMKKFGAMNEQNGYTLVEGRWQKPLAFLTYMVEKTRPEYVAEMAKIRQDSINATIANVRTQADSLVARSIADPEDKRIDPDRLARKEQEEAQRRLAEEERKKAEAEAKRLAEEEEKARKLAEEEERRLAELAAKQAALAAEQAEPAPKKSTAIAYVSGAILLTLIVFVWIVISIRRKRERERFKRFFEGKGQLQKDFWAMADEDPENFKYVAYMYPDLKAATEALLKLTYIQRAPNGELRCTRDIKFGVYPHLDGAVAFVGGPNFHYAPWREATAVLPELENAKYFRVSPEPEVKLVMPDIDKIAQDKKINIVSLGTEDVREEDGTFTRYYKFKADTKDMAMAFLEDFKVSEEGIVVQVETADGVFGKDENGIFTA